MRRGLTCNEYPVSSFRRFITRFVQTHQHIVGIESIASDQEPTQVRETTTRCKEPSLRASTGANISRMNPTSARDGRGHHLGPPHTVHTPLRGLFHQLCNCLSTHGETVGLNPIQRAIGEPPPSAHAKEKRTSCPRFQRLVSRCRRTIVEPRNNPAFHASSCQITSRRPSRNAQHAAAARRREMCSS